MTTDTRAAALTALQTGRPIAEIAAQTGLSTGQIAALAETTGATSEHARDALRDLIEALAWGEQHDTKKARALAARARRALTDLVQLRHEETAITQAREEIAALKKQLAAAEAKLRTARGGRTTAPAAAGAGDGAGTREERRAIRAWARAQGHQVADRGLLPGHLVTAYRNRSSASHT